ncbi:hypothetical protein J6X13_02255 [Candidatus Saccharibacteria bacterium]|nr:hypothetical protein [Candidatus Saccharibacteria bacterium]
MTKRKKGWLIGGIVFAVIAIGFAIEAIIVLNMSRNHFRLDASDYGPSEEIAIDDKDYAVMIYEKRSFVVFVDQAGCVKTGNMSEWLKDFPEEMQFKYYNLRWPFAKKTSLYDYVKYTPSIALINKGEVVAWLKADSDEDEKYYNDPEALKEWLSSYIIF